jgi:hypothetical protein
MSAEADSGAVFPNWYVDGHKLTGSRLQGDGPARAISSPAQELSGGSDETASVIAADAKLV